MTSDLTCRGCGVRTVGHWRDRETGERLPLCLDCQRKAASRPGLLEALGSEAAGLHRQHVGRAAEFVRAGLILH